MVTARRRPVNCRRCRSLRRSARSRRRPTWSKPVVPESKPGFTSNWLVAATQAPPAPVRPPVPVTPPVPPAAPPVPGLPPVPVRPPVPATPPAPVAPPLPVVPPLAVRPPLPLPPAPLPPVPARPPVPAPPVPVAPAEPGAPPLPVAPPLRCHPARRRFPTRRRWRPIRAFLPILPPRSRPLRHRRLRVRSILRRPCRSRPRCHPRPSRRRGRRSPRCSRTLRLRPRSRSTRRTPRQELWQQRVARSPLPSRSLCPRRRAPPNNLGHRPPSDKNARVHGAHRCRHSRIATMSPLASVLLAPICPRSRGWRRGQ